MGCVIVMCIILKAVFLYRLRLVVSDFLVLRRVRPKPHQERCKGKKPVGGGGGRVTEPAEGQVRDCRETQLGLIT